MNTRTLLTKLAFVLLGASSIFAAPPSDAEATRLLTAVWSRPAEKPGSVGAKMTLKPDGTFSSSATFSTASGLVTFQAAGKWRVESGVLIEELTRSSHPNLAAPGLVTRDTLLEVTEKEFRYRTEQGKERAYLRATGEARPETPK